MTYREIAPSVLDPFEGDPWCYVLTDRSGRLRLWPTFAEIPLGWRIAHGRADGRSCVEYVRSAQRPVRSAVLSVVPAHDRSGSETTRPRRIGVGGRSKRMVAALLALLSRRTIGA